MSYFITFEGIEGAGKTSVIKSVAEHLTNLGHSIVLTREPGATPLGRDIRTLLLDESESPPCSEAELFLFCADRAQHVQKLIKPALAQKKTVLCDRFTDSTIAYQGYGRGLSVETLQQLGDIATSGLQPHLTVLLDLNPATGLERANQRRGNDAGSWTRFEAEEKEFHTAVRNGFLELAKASPQRFRVVDASQPLCLVIEQSIGAIDDLIAQSLSRQ